MIVVDWPQKSAQKRCVSTTITPESRAAGRGLAARAGGGHRDLVAGEPDGPYRAVVAFVGLLQQPVRIGDGAQAVQPVRQSVRDVQPLPVQIGAVDVGPAQRIPCTSSRNSQSP